MGWPFSASVENEVRTRKPNARVSFEDFQDVLYIHIMSACIHLMYMYNKLCR